MENSEVFSKRSITEKPKTSGTSIDSDAVKASRYSNEVQSAAYAKRVNESKVPPPPIMSYNTDRYHPQQSVSYAAHPNESQKSASVYNFLSNMSINTTIIYVLCMVGILFAFNSDGGGTVAKFALPIVFLLVAFFTWLTSNNKKVDFSNFKIVEDTPKIKKTNFNVNAHIDSV